VNTTAGPSRGRSSTPSLALVATSLSGGYGRTIVVRDVSLEVPVGSITAVLGANGAGQTTLLKLVSGALSASSGQICVDGIDLSTMSAHRRVRLGMCHIPDRRGVFPTLTVRENLHIQAQSGKEADAVAKACEAFPALAPKLRQRAGTLSGGEQQMLAVSRIYVQQPKVVMIDEMSLGLAPMLVDGIFDFLRQMASHGTAIVLVDQFVSRVLNIADKVYIMSKGEVAYEGRSADLVDDDQIFSTYMGGS
jgi:branched-chain amino acid transport system ATP-binding protein